MLEKSYYCCLGQWSFLFSSVSPIGTGAAVSTVAAYGANPGNVCGAQL
jgi:hypothetical protein